MLPKCVRNPPCCCCCCAIQASPGSVSIPLLQNSYDRGSNKRSFIAMMMRSCHCRFVVVLFLVAAFVGAGHAFSTASCRQLSLASSTRTILFQAAGTSMDSKEAAAIIPGVGEEGYKVPSASKVNTLPKPFQAKVVLGYFAGLFLGTDVLTQGLNYGIAHYDWMAQWVSATFALGLGVIFVAAGAAHFVVPKDYENVMPPQGTWGLWYLPGSPAFHVAWTGVAEMVGGLGLIFGHVHPLWDPMTSDAATALVGLTIAVTPSNLFMYTHGAKLPRNGPEISVTGHFIRWILQMVLLSLLLVVVGPERFQEMGTAVSSGLSQ